MTKGASEPAPGTGTSGPAAPCPAASDVDGCLSVLVDSVTLEPGAPRWASLVKRMPLTMFQIRLREQLGLPTDRPIIMSGHQAELWHPGILAKWFAGAALAHHVGGVFVWLHVDQDSNEPGVIEAPATDASGAMVRRTLTLVEPRRDVPTGSRPATRIAPSRAMPPKGETLIHADAIARMVETLNRHAGAPSLGAQFARALHEIVGQRCGGESGQAHSITTTALASTDAFATLVDLMRQDPVRAIEHHNAAVATVPDAGIRALGLKHASSPDQAPRVELPLWRVQPNAPRTPVMLSQLASIPIAELRPRALLMTGVVRLGACDLFIHGTGGGIYDRITDLWFERWLPGTPLASSLPLAPITVATATARLDFGPARGYQSPLVSPAAALAGARAARHRVHHASHHPGLLGDAEAERAKNELVEAIRNSTDRVERAAIYRRMHALLERARDANASALERIRGEAELAARRAAEAPIVAERTWPFPLYPDATLAGLRTRIERAFATTDSSHATP